MAYASGTCGDNVTWELSDDGVLTLSGTGATYDYDDPMYVGNESPLSNQALYLDFEIDHLGEDYHFSAVVNSGITRLGNYVLAGAPIESVSLPGTLTEIGQGAFESGKLTSVSIPKSVTKIEVAAFRYNDLASIDIPANLTEIDMEVFRGNQLTGVTIPAWVTRIGTGAFTDCKIKSVSIPAGVTFCGHDAFDSDLFESFVVESGNTNYSAVDGVLFNGDKTEIIRYPIAKQTTNYHYDIPEGVKAIGYWSFRGALHLLAVTMPDTVTEVGGWAFDGVPLTSVKLSQNLSVIETGAFAETGITSIDLPDTLVTINGFAFEKTKLSAITLPESLTEIGNGAFSETQITSVIIPKNVESLSSSAFQEDIMVSYTVDEANNQYSSVDGVLYNKDKTELRIYPACKIGEEFTVPDTVVKISGTAFDHVNYLKKVTLPANVDTINSSAFGYPDERHIETLELKTKTPPTVPSNTLAPLATIIVPYGTGDKYKAAEGWKDYADIIIEAKGFPLRQFILGLLSELTAGSAKEPIAYLYNGVRLPKLPEWDRGVYPFAAITKTTILNTTSYCLYVAQSMYTDYYTEGDGGWRLLADGGLKSASISTSATEWPDPKAVAGFPTRLSVDTYSHNGVLWSNHSFYGPNGEEWITASDPVPVYE